MRQELPSPGVGVDFRLRRRLNKSWEKYGLGFRRNGGVYIKGGPRRRSRAKRA
jgi:hypothetical protein